MPKKSSLELSEIQTTVLDELDLLSDVFISTFSKIGETVKEFSTEIDEIIENLLPKNFKVNQNASYDLAYKPFCYNTNREYLIDDLTFEFAVEGKVAIRKEITDVEKKKYTNYFNLRWGFYYEKEDNSSKYFYIEMESKKFGNEPIISKNEYEEIINEIKKTMGFVEDFYELNHPESGDLEFFQLRLEKYKEISSLAKFFEVCKREFIGKFISKIKD